MAEPVRYPIPAALAALERGRHQVIEASAGTGKTHLIEHCVVDLVVSGAAAIDGIAVVTFTEKATAELRRRVRRVIERAATGEPPPLAPGQPAWTIDDAARARLIEALTSFDRAQISTIHALCQRVLTENAFASRRLFVQTQVASETAFASAFRAELRERFAREPEEAIWLQAWMEAGDGHTIAELGKRLHRCADLGGRITPAVDPARLSAAADALAASRPDPAEVDRLLRRAKVNAGSVKAQIDRLEGLGEILAGWPTHRHPARLLAAIECRDDSFLSHLSKLAAKARDLPALAGFGDALGDLIGAAVPLDAAVVQRFLPAVLARARRDKDRLGQFDFRDMLELVGEALQGPGGDALAARLRARWSHALIDEFQDTDDVQWRIFRKVWAAGDGRLYLVGDPKQAIYGFRAADVHTYLDARDQLLDRGGQLTALVDSWRSTPELVGALNDLFVDDGADSLFSPAGRVRCPEPLRAAAGVVAVDAAGHPVVPVELMALPAERARAVDPARDALIKFAVAEIDALLHDPARRLEVGIPPERGPRPEDRLRPVTRGDIFVLTRSVAEAEQAAAALRDAGIRCALYQQEGLFQTPEADEVRDLLSAVADPGDPPARLRAWRTRFFAAELGELTDLAALPETHPWVARLYEWKALADRLDYETLFARVVAESRLVERELFRRGGERGITNIEHLFELLLEEVLRARCEIHELIARLGAWKSDVEGLTIDERNIQRLESERDAVQVMTVHKAKGLQAKVVFVIGGMIEGGGGSAKVYHRGGERLIHVGAGAPGECGVEAAEENQRLLYVALTRAVGKLYVPWLPPQTSPWTGMMAALQRRVDVLLGRRALGDGGAAARFTLRPLSPLPHAVVIDEGRGGGPTTPTPWTPPPDLLAPPPPASDLTALRDQRRGISITSYTRLSAAGAWRAAIEPAELKADVDAASAPVSEHLLPGGAATGIFLHEALELVDFAGVTAAGGLDAWRALPEVTRLFRDLGARHGIAARHLEHAQQLVHDALALPVALGGRSLPALAGCARELREVEFLYPVPGGRVHATGVIDLIFEHGGLTYLLDWKSDVLDDYGAAAIDRHVRAHYGLQSRLYALALVKMLGAAAEERFGGIAYLFLRGRGAEPADGIQFERPALAELHAFAARLEGLA